MFLTMLGAVVISTVDLPVTKCFNERHPVGTGVPMRDAAAVKSDKNLIVSVSEVLAGKHLPQKGTPYSPLGYVIGIANGESYYEFGSELLAQGQASEKAFLERADLKIPVKQLASLIQAGGSGLLKLRIPSSAYKDGVWLRPCTSLKKRK